MKHWTRHVWNIQKQLVRVLDCDPGSAHLAILKHEKTSSWRRYHLCGDQWYIRAVHSIVPAVLGQTKCSQLKSYCGKKRTENSVPVQGRDPLTATGIQSYNNAVFGFWRRIKVLSLQLQQACCGPFWILHYPDDVNQWEAALRNAQYYQKIRRAEFWGKTERTTHYVVSVCTFIMQYLSVHKKPDLTMNHLNHARSQE